MKKKSAQGLENLPAEFKALFDHTIHQIRRFGDAIHLIKFSFLANQIVFLADLDDDSRNAQAAFSRSLIYEVFGKDRTYVDEKINELEDHAQEYLESLYGQALVYLWTSLEDLVKRLIAALIDYDKGILTAEPFRKLNIPMAEFFRLDADERAPYLTDLIISGLKCGPKHGIERFECFLGAFGLAGQLKTEHKRRILALHHLRNCIVHSDSTADRRLCKECAWLGYELGDKVVITEKDFRDHEKSVLAYIVEMFYRLNKELGAPENFLQVLRAKIDRLAGANTQV